ncbi:MAG TPA: DUF6029 family protein [Saprospiraceae bacterium]|nr:DUF6029 family protein [Saprospiraceae bacterium]HMP22985.1 DUF6029 family protein [Saprospiraceae bacterium]
MKLICSAIIFLLLTGSVLAQSNRNDPRISGSLETNANFFIRDTLIGAANTPQYDRQLYGADAWLNLMYSNWGFDFGLRFDLFNNSNLLNPTGSYTDEGIGRWFINKKINRLGISAGYLYDQIGSGIIFRAYEERPLLIDNALYGLRLTYDLVPDWQVKAFTGRQKQQFDIYGSVLRGLSVEGFLTLGDSTAGVALAPGFGVISRTLDDPSMNSLVATLNTYPASDIFVPKYNTYAFSFYNTLSSGPISWYLEAAYKTEDAMNDPFGTITREGVSVVGDKFIQRPGSVLYSSLSYAQSGFGFTLEAKRTENFSFRTRPQEQLNRGLVNFLPPMAKVNTYRLTARYNAATQELGELAFQADARYLFNKNWSANVNVSNITTLENALLYREIYAEIGYKYKRDWSLLGGVQMQNYNQRIYEFKPDVPNVQTVTPFAEFLYKFSRTRSMRLEAQAMLTGEDQAVELRQDYGNWLFGLAEFSVAPHWTFTVSDMYNMTPGRQSPENSNGEKVSVHYPRVDVYYTFRSNRFSLSYVKQVEGVVCAGGICRLEPAFSGVKMTVNSTF